MEAGRPPPPQSPLLSGLATSLASIPSPEPWPGPRAAEREASELSDSRRRQLEPQDSLLDSTSPGTLIVWDYQEKRNKSNVEKAKAIFCPVRLLSPFALYLCPDKLKSSSVCSPHSAASEKPQQVPGGAVHEATQFRILGCFTLSDLFLGLPRHLCSSLGNWGELEGEGLFIEQWTSPEAECWPVRNSMGHEERALSKHSGHFRCTRGKMDKEDLVIFNLYSNFYTSLV